MRIVPAAASLDVVLRDIGPDDITPHFQPILELRSGAILGYEILSRGPAPYESPALLFGRARELGLTADLEYACRAAAAARIAKLAPDVRRSQWFVNISPDVFCDGARSIDRIVQSMHDRGFTPNQVVLELTERAPIVDAERLENAVRVYVAAGFRIALDDFGSGVNGLLTLLICKPHVIKLDMELTRRLDENAYKQHIVHSIVSLAAEVNAEVIAEGVASRAERDALCTQGVKFAQGRFFAAPAEGPFERIAR